MNTKSFSLSGNELTLADLQPIANGAKITISPNVKATVEKSRKWLIDQLQHNKPIYGVNTGFGYYAKTAIPHSQLLELQVNLIRSHASGWGNPLSTQETRLAMTLRLHVLTKGYTAVRYSLIDAMLKLIDHEIFPIIPEYGSVGASGDLAPLAHLALALIGEGKVNYKGEIITASVALKKAGLSPFVLEEKEGLGLINGTQIMLAVGGLALSHAISLSRLATLIGALSVEGLEGRPDAFEDSLHQVRNQMGQIKVAEELRSHLKGSSLYQAENQFPRVQDPYSLRCIPQVHGASYDGLDYAKTIIERELNGATDNPLVFVEENRVLSGGNFHGQPIALAFDFAAIALAEIGNISERRVDLLFNPQFSQLSPFLAPEPGVTSGYMAAQYLAACLVNENKGLANPASTDSIPGNVGVEDHVSMGMTSARKLRKIVDNIRTQLAVELICAAQAVSMKKRENALGEKTGDLYRELRKVVPVLDRDRIISDDIALARTVIVNQTSHLF
jgi:histidine ammonia-lyase